MTTPRWLHDMLVAQGTMSESGLTRTARIRTHRTCGTPCLSAIDDLGFDTWCDLGELSRAGEVEALLEQRSTWDLWAGQLGYRYASSIAGHPAGGSRPVFAEHRCGEPIRSSWCVPRRAALQPKVVDF